MGRVTCRVAERSVLSCCVGARVLTHHFHLLPRRSAATMSSDFLKLRLRAQEQEFSRQRDLNAYKTIRDSLKATGQLEVRPPVPAMFFRLSARTRSLGAFSRANPFPPPARAGAKNCARPTSTPTSTCVWGGQAARERLEERLAKEADGVDILAEVRCGLGARIWGLGFRVCKPHARNAMRLA
jgi:hypothetical protein